MRLASMRGVMQTQAHICRFGMKQEDENGEASVLKPTGFFTNSVCLVDEFDLTCTGGHRRITLHGGRTKQAQVYPDDLRRATCRGTKAPNILDAAGFCVVIGLQSKHPLEDRREGSDSVGEIHGVDGWMAAWDDVTGRELDPDKVRQARVRNK